MSPWKSPWKTLTAMSIFMCILAAAGDSSLLNWINSDELDIFQMFPKICMFILLQWRGMCQSRWPISLHTSLQGCPQVAGYKCTRRRTHRGCLQIFLATYKSVQKSRLRFPPQSTCARCSITMRRTSHASPDCDLWAELVWSLKLGNVWFFVQQGPVV